LVLVSLDDALVVVEVVVMVAELPTFGVKL
jgi:hypothetical protein